MYKRSTEYLANFEWAFQRIIFALGYIVIAVIATRAVDFSFYYGDLESVRITFSGMIVILSSIFLGPYWGAFIGGAKDLIGFLTQSNFSFEHYLPSITAINVLWGLIPGFIYRFLETRIHKGLNTLITVAVPQLLLSVVAMSYILFWNFGISLEYSFTNRIMVQAVTIPVYVLIIYLILNYKESERTVRDKEQKLRESEHRLDTLISQTPAVIFSYTLTAGTPEITFVSKNVKPILGFEPEDFINNHEFFKECLHPEDAQKVFAATPKLLEEGKVTLEEYRFKDRQGQYHWLHDEQKLITNADGTLEVIGAWWDITERKQAEEALNEKNLFIEKILSSLPNTVVYIFDLPTQQNIYASKNLYDVVGYTAAEFQAMGDTVLKQLIHPDNLEPFMEYLDVLNTLQEDDVRNFEYRMKHKNGHWIWIENRDTIFTYDESGKPLQTIGSALDITARKQAEQKLADYTLELEQLYHQLDDELDKARQVHERILPTYFPALKGLSFAAHYRPAQTMGGDFYDIIQKDNKLIFYLSDVSGHGLNGAMLSVFVKHTIKSYISFTPADELSPAAILRHLAEQFGREDYPEDLYVCLLMAVLDPDSMELSYCSAGLQEALLLQLGNGERLTLHSKGMFITSYLPLEILILQEDRIKLTPGSTIFCNTDGLTEQECNGAYYMERLPEVFFQNAHLPSHLVVQAIVEDFFWFNKGSLQGKDDITFLVLQVAPPVAEV